MNREQKMENRRLALQIASTINKKEEFVEIPCMVTGFEEQGSLEKLLSDAEKIFHWLNKDC